MGDVNFNSNFNLTINFFPNDQRNLPAMPLGGGISASASSPLAAGPFAFPMLPAAFLLQGFKMLQQQGGTPQLVAQPEAQWNAQLQGQGKGSIDLGDGYTLDLDENNSQITIHNEETGETTKIWGDPHVDVDGKHAFDFAGTTTFTLENGTKITINTEQWKGNPDAYVASKVTITKGDQAIVVDGISQNKLGDLNVSMSNNGRAIDAATRDGFVLNENASGSGWRSDLTGKVATQDDLNATMKGGLYGPGSTMPSFDDIRQELAGFLLMGFAGALANAVTGGGNSEGSAKLPFIPPILALAALA
jgi:hypothetical protein